jgi:class 3 adenylate cyclase
LGVSGQGLRTLGFLFADLRGYTKYIERHGDTAAAELVRKYRRVAREIVARYAGDENSTEGDSFFVVFESVSAAVRCGADILSACGSIDPPIQLGVGVHAGEAASGDVGFVAGPVNIAARLCALARAGDMLVTDAVRALTRTALEMQFQSVGLKRLKGVDEPTMVWRIEVPGAARAADDALPPRWMRLAIVPALLVSTTQLGLTAYWLLSNALVPGFGIRFGDALPSWIDPVMIALIGAFTVFNLVATVVVIAAPTSAIRVAARLVVATTAMLGVIAPFFLVAVESRNAHEFTAAFVVAFFLMAMAGCGAVIYGWYRRRLWVVGVGYAVCALFVVSAQLLPVAMAGAWAISVRRENALY